MNNVALGEGQGVRAWEDSQTRENVFRPLRPHPDPLPKQHYALASIDGGGAGKIGEFAYMLILLETFFKEIRHGTRTLVRIVSNRQTVG
jgi:hypothetical protein